MSNKGVFRTAPATLGLLIVSTTDGGAGVAADLCQGDVSVLAGLALVVPGLQPPLDDSCHLVVTHLVEGKEEAQPGLCLHWDALSGTLLTNFLCLPDCLSRIDQAGRFA